MGSIEMPCFEGDVDAEVDAQAETGEDGSDEVSERKFHAAALMV